MYRAQSIHSVFPSSISGKNSIEKKNSVWIEHWKENIWIYRMAYPRLNTSDPGWDCWCVFLQIKSTRERFSFANAHQIVHVLKNKNSKWSHWPDTKIPSSRKHIAEHYATALVFNFRYFLTGLINSLIYIILILLLRVFLLTLRPESHFVFFLTSILLFISSISGRFKRRFKRSFKLWTSSNLSLIVSRLL